MPTQLSWRQIIDDTVPVAKLSATGTKDGTKFLRDDNTWQVPVGGGGGWLTYPQILSITSLRI
jgi:hypothetical protein